MTYKEAKNTICAFSEQILKELWLTREARNGLGEALDLAIEALEKVDMAMKLRVKVGDVTYEDE